LCIEELLCLLGRVETLHLSLSPSRRAVRIPGRIIEIAAGTMSDVREGGMPGNAVAA
jgi:hypothetical protein